MRQFNKTIKVFEHTKLRYDGIQNEFTKTHFDALCKFNELHRNKYFTVVHKGILFNSYVGVIQIANLTIEILPKADKDSGADKRIWQSVLVNMLNVCKYIQVDNVSEAYLSKKYDSVLEIYFDLFLREIEHLTRLGLIKKYISTYRNLTALKGKLNFSKNIQRNVCHMEKFYCDHQQYSKDHLIHQIILRALLILEAVVRVNLKDRVRRLLQVFLEYKKVQIASADFDNLSLDRKSASYIKALNMSKMIILNYSSNLNAGGTNMLTLLFDMNKLWEEYIFRILLLHQKKNVHISAQNSKRFWMHRNVRPDILIQEEGKCHIIDTKWKILESSTPSDEDLRQIFVYNLVFQAERGLLIYPKTNQLDSKHGNYSYKHHEHSGNWCRAIFVDILENGKMMTNKKVAESIWKELELDIPE